MDNLSEQKCAYIILLGAPNAGKSTLVNHIVGAKVSIVSPKVQTTRASIKGIYVKDETQLVFIDAPGVFSPKKKLERAIVREAWQKVEEADFIAVLVDSKRGICTDTKNIMNFLTKTNRKALLILNKTDTVNPERLLPLAKELNETGLFSDTFMISATKGQGVEPLTDHLCKIAPKSFWGYPADQLTDAPIRFFAAELTREKIFMRLQQEIPYSIAVETESWKENKKGEITIHQVIYVQRAGQKAIILGKGGSMIKQIGESCRKELSAMLETKVNLILFVKVSEKWMDNPAIYKEIGLDMVED